MPSNKKEEIIFGSFMCFGMVTIMLCYNAFVLGISEMTMGKFVTMYVITFVVAFIIESIVGPAARKVALSLPYDKSNPSKVVVAIATCMVPTMVLIMSAYGLLLKDFEGGIEGPLWQAYLIGVGLNIIVAYPSQLIIVGPISRRLMFKYVKVTPKPLNAAAK